MALTSVYMWQKIKSLEMESTAVITVIMWNNSLCNIITCYPYEKFSACLVLSFWVCLVQLCCEWRWWLIWYILHHSFLFSCFKQDYVFERLLFLLTVWNNVVSCGSFRMLFIIKVCEIHTEEYYLWKTAWCNMRCCYTGITPYCQYLMLQWRPKHVSVCACGQQRQTSCVISS
jgi:hypothetical protein